MGGGAMRVIAKRTLREFWEEPQFSDDIGAITI